MTKEMETEERRGGGDFCGGKEEGGKGEADSYEGGKRKGWMSPPLHNLRQGWCSARGQGLSRKGRFQLLFREAGERGYEKARGQRCFASRRIK